MKIRLGQLRIQLARSSRILLWTDIHRTLIGVLAYLHVEISDNNLHPQIWDCGEVGRQIDGSGLLICIAAVTILRRARLPLPLTMANVVPPAARDQLESRVLPQMILSEASNPLTAPLKVPEGLFPSARTERRFSVEGNAIGTGGSDFLGITSIRALLEHGASGIAIFDVGPSLSKAMLLAVLEVEGPDTIRTKKGPDAGKEISILKMVLGDEEGNVCKLVAWREIAEVWGRQ
ncbi:hypothetical protein D9758_011848 [Tetrapyrgos nigripes]|uniref:Uncharacterized protein n=1 Tax=Tetrapyrgos nigripes TaxID=182062 RepID=A0A8H5CKI2_9AGAR|nr:hypothetical protein D9758_011848 [Tetrapyrgos nigripes]